MEDLEVPEKSPPMANMPEAGHDPGDPLAPSIEEENSTPTPPVTQPHEDMELTGTNEVDRDDNSDAESALSDVDEDQFKDFDPTAVAIDEHAALEDRPALVVDESNLNLLGVHKRKRADGDGAQPRKKKQIRRSTRSRRSKPDDSEAGGDNSQQKQSKKKSARKEGEPKAQEDPTAHMTEDDRKRYLLDQKMDELLKSSRSRRWTKKEEKKYIERGEKDIEAMRQRMVDAAQKDFMARSSGKPAVYKLKLLPEVMNLLGRSVLQGALVDPDINLIEAIRFFLEPLNDGSLPSYTIQRELFTALAKLPITRDTLIASGIGKVAIFYTKTTKAEPNIKRQAERLLMDWMRPILRRTADYRSKQTPQDTYEPGANATKSSSRVPTEADILRENSLADPSQAHRARVDNVVRTYTIAPQGVSEERARSYANPHTRAPGQAAGEIVSKMIKRRARGDRG